MRRFLLPATLVTAYALCPVLANYLVTHHAPIDVLPLPGLRHHFVAPAAVYVIGAALVLRNLVQRTAGVTVSLVAIALGCVTSLLVADPRIVVASVAAFAFSELLDFAVFTSLFYNVSPFAPSALIASFIGAVADSYIFLSLAFGSLAFFPGQLAGKSLSVLAAVLLIAAGDHLYHLYRQRRHIHHPAATPSTST